VSTEIKKHYVNNKSLLQLLISYKANPTPSVLNQLGKMFILISQNYCNKPNFINYSYDRKEEMISDAYMMLLYKLNEFDTTRDNPFAYFTRIVHNCFLQYIKKYKKQRQTFTSFDTIEQYPEFIINSDDNMNKYEKNNYCH
jgi:DNA-directed RNA polymerase specialized sigma24 family protein